MTRREKAAALNSKARRQQKRGNVEESIRLYQKAAALAPRWSVPLYNLGLLFKYQHRWQKSLMYNRQATELDPGNEAAWWNLGIAATALGRWKQARAAWRGFGIDIPDGEGPLDFPCGYGPIRLDPDGQAEVVWAHRIDPARAVIASIPFPESGYRWRDIALNDGAPVGYRQYDGKDYPVLNVLQFLEASPFGTFVATVALPRRGKLVVRLAEIAAEQEGSAEDWTTSVHILCRACSEGRPHSEHDTEAAPPEGAHLIGIAARSRAHATRILSTWEAESRGVRVESLDDALEPGPPN
jgi:hypothetical protein